jgi:N4-gp56 family major capsid protein|tara:strand:- start:5 stop:856 length:852 start_codon:yes stop_codon:yes gene_type:complete
MSTNLSPAFVQLFEAEVHQAYQGTAQLRGAARMRENVQGDTVKFPKVGKGQASVRVPQTDVVPINSSFSQVSVSLTDYVASEYSDIFNQQKINFDERQELAQVVGNAIGRREDQILIDALNAASAGTTVAKTVVTSGSASASNLNIGKILAAKKALDAKSVPVTDRHFVIHANNLAGLLGDERAISSDFQTVQALVSGQIGQMMGFTFHTIGDRDEGGLPLSTNDRTCFAFHRSALGCAVGIAPKTEINYIPEKTSFLVTAMLSMGASAIDVDGIVDVVCDES